MTIQFTIEDFCDSRDDLYPLFEDHYAEITSHKEVKELAPDWDSYRVLEDNGKCLTVVARDDGKVAGYMTTFLYPHPHYRECLVASNDLFFVHPEYRDQGVASRMLDFTEEELRKRGASIHTMHMKVYHDFSGLMERKGFSKSEIIWERVLEN